METKPNESEFFALDVPKRDGKVEYLVTILNLYLRLGGILADANFRETDIRIFNMANLLISTIPGEKKRQEIRNQMNKDIEEALKKTPGNEDRGRARNAICIEYLGKVTDYIDIHFGIDEENRVGIVI